MPLAKLNFGNVSTPYPIYTVPALKQCAFSVNVNNRNTPASANSGVVHVRLALTTGGAPDPAGGDWIEYDVSIGPNSSFERAGLVLQAGEVLYGQTDTLGVAAQVYGFEEYTSSNLANNSSLSSADIDAGQG